jgi:hypothetical protein
MFEIEQRAKQLETYLIKATDRTLPEETQAHLVRFGTVLVCGYVERSLEIIITERLNKKAHPRVINFIRSQFKRGRNMDCEAIGQLLVRFDPEWKKRFEAFVTANPQIESAMSSCYSVRNSVAHGGSSSLGARQLKELLDSSIKLIDGIIEVTKGK